VGKLIFARKKRAAEEKSVREVPPLVNIILLSIIGLFVVLIVIGTIYGFARTNKKAPLFTLGNPGNEQLRQSDDIRVYSGLGRMRIPLSNSSVLIISIAFPYSENDTAFTEELAVKIDDFRGIVINYFSALPPEKLIHIDEDAAKKEVLRQYNNNLRLGKISALYFSDFLVIDGVK